MSKSAHVLMVLAGLAGCAGNPGGGGGDDAAIDGGGDGSGDDVLGPFTRGVSTLSGHSSAGDIDGVRGVARFANPVNVAVGPDGTLYVADFDNGKIRVVDAATGTTTTLIAKPGFARPFALAFAADGTLYVSTDFGPSGDRGAMAGTIWRIDVAAKTAVPIAARIGKPRGIAVLGDGRLAIADYQHHVIELLDPHTGLITPLAGAWDATGMIDGVGAGARFAVPYDLVVRDGKLIVADHDNHRIRIVGLNGSVTTLAGTGVAGFADGALAAAQFDRPQGVAVAANGDLFVTDVGNFRVRKISGNTVETVAGNGTGGHRDGDDRLAAELYGLEGLAVASSGSMVFVADGGRGEPLSYNYIRRIELH